MLLEIISWIVGIIPNTKELTCLQRRNSFRWTYFYTYKTAVGIAPVGWPVMKKHPKWFGNYNAKQFYDDLLDCWYDQVPLPEQLMDEEQMKMVKSQMIFSKYFSALVEGLAVNSDTISLKEFQILPAWFLYEFAGVRLTDVHRSPKYWWNCQ